jgi:hypothetical protein
MGLVMQFPASEYIIQGVPVEKEKKEIYISYQQN